MADLQTQPNAESAESTSTQAVDQSITPERSLGRRGMSLLIALGLACLWVMLMAKPAQ